MRRTSPYHIELTKEERDRLQASVRRYSSAYRAVTRAKIVLLAAEGMANDEIAARLGTPRQIVSKWRKRFHEQRLLGLQEQPRTGRPPVFPPGGGRGDQSTGVRAARRQWRAAGPPRISPEPPSSRVSSPRSRTLPSSGGSRPTPSVPGSIAVGPSPAIRTSRGRPAGCSTSITGGVSMANRSADATSSSAPTRRPPSKHATAPPAPGGRAMRIEHEYERGGALAYLAAWDVHRAKLFGRCEPSTGIEPFGRLVGQVMGTELYASAERVFWIVDNGSSHRGRASIDRLQGAWSNLVLVHLPVHASWLNQIENRHTQYAHRSAA